MFVTKVPRVFVLAGFVLAFLVLSTNFYLYDDATYVAAVPAAKVGSDEGELSPAIGLQDPAPEVEKPLADDDGSGSAIVSPTIGPASAESATESPVAAPAEAPATTAVNAKPVSSIQGTQADQTSKDNVNNGDGDNSLPPASSPGECPDLEFLKLVHAQEGLSDKVQYRKICIEPIFSKDVDRNAIASVSTPLFDDEVTVDVDKCHEAELPKCTPVKLSVPKPPAEFDVSHLIFGISSGYNRLEESIDAFAHWLSRPSGDGAQLVALVTDYTSHKENKIHNLQQQFRAAGINVKLMRPVDESYSTSESHFAVLAHMLNSSSPATQWYGLLDDDTFCK
jgi:hypothetical protein